MSTVSEIGFDGEIGGTITDTNEQIVTKHQVGSNTIDMDGSGNGVFTLVTEVTDTPGLTECYISEPVISDTDLLDKDFTITLSDYVLSNSDMALDHMFFTGDLSTLTGYVLQYPPVANNLVIIKITGGAIGGGKTFDLPGEFNPTISHDFVMSRTSGTISISLDSVPLEGEDYGIDGTTWTSYAGTGIILLGVFYDVGTSFVKQIGNFSIDVAGASTMSAFCIKSKKIFRRGL